MTQTKSPLKRLTIDHTRGLYIEERETGTREYPYRSRRSASHTASYLHWRGYTVLIINEPNNAKKKGVSDVFDFTDIEDPQYIANRLRVFAERGSNFITASHREKFCTLGLLERKGRGLRLTAKGHALMGQYPPTGDATTNGHAPEPAQHVDKNQHAADLLRVVLSDSLDALQPSVVSWLRANAWVGGVGVTDAGFALMEQYPAKPAQHVDPFTLDDDMTAWQQAHANPQPQQPDTTRAALLRVRATLLGVIRDHLPAPIQPLADEVTRINALLED